MMLSCAFSRCACRCRIWESELWRPLIMLSESRGSWWHQRYWLKLSFRFLFFKWCSAAPFHFARAGVVFESVYPWGHFSCSVKGDDPNGVDDVDWSWVFDFWRCWLKLSFWVLSLNDAVREVFLKMSFSLCACGRRIWECDIILFL